MNFKSQQLQKYVSLSIGILGSLIAGIVYGFNIYAISLKRTFNFTQSELDNIASAGDLGIPMSFPAGVIVDRFGPRIACTVSLILTTMGFLLMLMATEFRLFFSSKSWLLCAFYFLASFGLRFLVIAPKVVCCKLFDRKHVGKVLGLVGAFRGISPAIFSAIYRGLFVQGHIEDAENQKLGEFMIMLAVLSACINLYGVVMLKVAPEETSESDETELSPVRRSDIDANGATTDEKSNGPREKENKQKMSDTTALIADKIARSPQPEMNCLQMIKTSGFYYIFIICIIFAGTCGTLINNITIVVKSARIDPYSLPFPVVISICMSLGQLLGGTVSDFIIQKWPDVLRGSFLLFPGIIFIISQITLIFYNQSLICLIFSSVILSLLFGSVFPLTNVIVLRYYGMEHFGQNIGLIAASYGIGMVLFQTLFASNYDTYTSSGSKDCYGEMCTKWYFVLMTIICSCAVFLIFCLMKIERDQQQESLKS
ncbi:unnamed protein product [Owenia fusiformis]|uniref:Uncharacterized protein n=1 Tax=Owenia fusiformis TaxID=6347 RepID=A0A8J1U344_OWEFU|nr:unnamed protein product [Owenia fusiformis]